MHEREALDRGGNIPYYPIEINRIKDKKEE
jgi:hypothetical protein